MNSLSKIALGLGSIGTILALGTSGGTQTQTPASNNVVPTQNRAVEDTRAPSVKNHVAPETATEKTVPAKKSATPNPIPVKTEAASSGSSCHPSYSGCLKIGAGDYDCAGGSGNGPNYTGTVQVIGPDVFDLDRDHDGWGCE